MNGALANLPMPDADYNIAPTTSQPSSGKPGDGRTGDGVGTLEPHTFFTKDLSEAKGTLTINARAETIVTARTWREQVKKRRCLIPVADVWYTWKDGQGY